jgi:hypothetical protein
MSVAVVAYCKRCGVAAPEVGDAGFIGAPTLASGKRGGLASFGAIHDALSALRLTSPEIEAFRAFLDAHDHHGVVRLSDVDEDDEGAPRPRRLKSFRFRAAGFVAGSWELRCEKCQQAFRAEAEAIRPFAPHTLTAAEVARFQRHAPGSDDDAVYRVGGFPFDAMDDVHDFLRVHQRHGLAVTLERAGSVKTTRTATDVARATNDDGTTCLQMGHTASRLPEAPLSLRPELDLRWAFKRCSATLGMPLVGPSHVVAFDVDRGTAVLDRAGKRLWGHAGSSEAIIGTDLLAVARVGKRWRYVVLDLASGREHYSLAVGEDDDIVAVLPEARCFIDRSGPRPMVRLRRIENGFPVVWARTWTAGKIDLRAACDSERCLMALHSDGGVTIVALRRDTGRPLWSRPIDMAEPCEEGGWWPRVAEGRLIFTTKRGTAALDVRDGRTIWYKPGLHDRGSTYGGRAYFMAGGTFSLPSLTALDTKRGRVAWRREYPELRRKGDDNRLMGSLAISETHIFGVDRAGWIWALDRSNGAPVWSHRPPGSKGFDDYASPVIAGGCLYVISGHGYGTPHLYCYEQRSASGVRKGR